MWCTSCILCIATCLYKSLNATSISISLLYLAARSRPRPVSMFKKKLQHISLNVSPLTLKLPSSLTFFILGEKGSVSTLAGTDMDGLNGLFLCSLTLWPYTMQLSSPVEQIRFLFSWEKKTKRWPKGLDKINAGWMFLHMGKILHCRQPPKYSSGELRRNVITWRLMKMWDLLCRIVGLISIDAFKRGVDRHVTENRKYIHTIRWSKTGGNASGA